jgi:hypothetical protein
MDFLKDALYFATLAIISVITAAFVMAFRAERMDQSMTMLA